LLRRAGGGDESDDVCDDELESSPASDDRSDSVSGDGWCQVGGAVAGTSSTTAGGGAGAGAGGDAEECDDNELDRDRLRLLALSEGNEGT
jgi:hypothetical protein